MMMMMMMIMLMDENEKYKKKSSGQLKGNQPKREQITLRWRIKIEMSERISRKRRKAFELKINVK